MKNVFLLIALLSLSLLTAVVGVSSVALAASPSGEVSYFLTSSGACTSNVWTPTHGGGAVEDIPNNVGGPPNTAEVVNGQKICIEVSFSNVPDGTYKITSPALIGFLLVPVSGGSGDNETVFTVESSVVCDTAPIFMSPSVSGLGPGNSGQINHLFIGNDCPTAVPEFGGAGSIGFVLATAIAAPLLIILRRRDHL